MGSQVDENDTRTVIGLAEGLVKDHMARYDPSHDWAHVDRVRKTALNIAKTLAPLPDLLIVELVALFHDLADGMVIDLAWLMAIAKYGSTDTLYPTLQPFFASPAVQTLSTSQTKLILEIIPNISWSTEKKLRASKQWTEWHDNCSELHAVQDADRLDAIGSVGIMRCAAYSAAAGRKLVSEEEGDDSAESHFAEKLLLIKDRMKTPWGKEEALRRHETMVHFLDDLQREKLSR